MVGVFVTVNNRKHPPINLMSYCAIVLELQGRITIFIVHILIVTDMGEEMEMVRDTSPVRSDSGTEDTETHDLPKLQYSIEDVPPFYLWIFLGFQVL